MYRFFFAGSLLAAFSVAAAAFADSTPPSGAPPAGYFTEAGAPLVAPIVQGATSPATAEKQETSGYYPYADAPLVAPIEGDAGAASTLRKQVESGYFPYAGAPLVSPNPSVR